MGLLEIKIYAMSTMPMGTCDIVEYTCKVPLTAPFNKPTAVVGYVAVRQ
jgi:hypothetical protein